MLRLLVLLVWLTAPATAAPEAAREAYMEGRYADAADLAEDGGSASGLILAAQAIQTRLLLEGADAGEARRARRLAERALEREPNSVEALIQIAVSYGMEARASGSAMTYFRGSPRKGREALDRALSLEPANARARAVSGAWHLEVLWRGGEAGERLYGADLETGIAEFEAAMRLGAEAMAGTQFAQLLAVHDETAHRESINHAIAWTLDQPAPSHLDRVAQDRARRLEEVLARGEPLAPIAEPWLN